MTRVYPQPGQLSIFVASADGAGLIQLTADPAYDDQAAISADGKQLAFVSTRSGGKAHIWTMDLATPRPKSLTSPLGGDYRPTWSPDGKWIAFSSDRGNPMPFAHGRWERFQLTEIYIVRPDGAGLKKITKSDEFCGSPKWRDDGHVLASCITAEQTLGNRRTSPNPATTLVWSRLISARERSPTTGRSRRQDQSVAASRQGYRLHSEGHGRSRYLLRERTARAGRSDPLGVMVARWRARCVSPTIQRRRALAEKDLQSQSRLRVKPPGSAARFQPERRGIRDQ